MVREYEYFTEFLNDPSAFPNREFYEKTTEWAKYVLAHAAEFNYLEDDQWKEIRERLLEELEIRDAVRADFEEIDFQISILSDFNNADRVKICSRFLSFMEKHQKNFEFPDEQIAEYRNILEKFAGAVRQAQISEDNLKLLKAEKRKQLEKLDDQIAEHSLLTGKKVVLTSLRHQTNYRGN